MPVCDICDKKKGVRKLTAKTSNWCAWWFHGNYCKHCYKAVETVMKATVKADRKLRKQQSKL